MKYYLFFILTSLLVLTFSETIAQKWRMSFQPTEKVDFYMTQKDGVVYAMLKSGNTQNLFLRVTGGNGENSRYYFKEEPYIQVVLPSSGYIALASESVEKRIQYVYASQRINKLSYSESEEFFQAAEGVTSKAALKGQKSPKVVQQNRNLNTSESDGGGIQDNTGFNPTRKKDIRKAKKEVVAITRSVKSEALNSEMGSRLTEALAANETYKSKIDHLESRLEKMKGAIDQLQSELEDCDGKVRKYEFPEYNSKSLIVGVSGSFFNLNEDCETCELEKLTGTPLTLEVGVSFNSGKVHKAIMLAAGVLPVNMTPGSLEMDNIFGLKMMLMGKKYAVSGTGLMTPSMSYMSAKAGFGVWVMPNSLLMAEIGFAAGDMDMLYTKQLAPTIGLSLVRSFRKQK